MYPEYLKTAIKEGSQQAAWSFEVANKVEKIHAKLFSKAVKNMVEGDSQGGIDYYVCSVC